MTQSQIVDNPRMPMIADALAQVREEDYTVKVCRALFTAAPGGPPFVVYQDLAGALRRLDATSSGDALARTEELAAQPDAERALWVADALDRADMGLAAFAGLKNVFSLFTGSRGPRARTFESDSEQAADAAVKLLGVSYMAFKLFPGAPADCASRLVSLPAGRETLLYYAAVEVGLPFADNLLQGGASVFSRLAGLASGEGATRFGKVMGAEAAGQSARVLQSLRRPVEEYLDVAKGYLDPVTQSLRGFVPSALGAADSVTGVAAGALDALPIWRFLGARLSAEACGLRALGLA
jgi:hypothetical protein